MKYDVTAVIYFTLLASLSSLEASRSSRPSGSASSAVVSPVVHHGVIREDAVEGSEVKMDVPLTVSNRKSIHNGDICGYKIYKTQSDFPFKIADVDRRTGQARVLLAAGARLDYERKHEYVFEVAAHACESSTLLSERENIHIEVEDVNEYAPTWSQPSFTVDAVEGRVYDYIVHLEAVDRDGADGISRICHYRILTPDVPFEVDNDGYLRNTEPLNYNVKSKYSIDVKAEDCAGRSSDKTVVVINVKPFCRPSWTGIADRVEFVPREGRRLVASGAELELCDNACNFTQLAVTVKLATEHIGKGCDRDTYSLQSQRKLCGASDNSIDLLPNPALGGWTKELPTDDGLESDQIFAFDGKTTAIEIPSDKLDFNLGNSFTLSTWMKHSEEEPNEKTEVHGDPKEHIICHSDGEGMNRHHYSVFIHNCRLVLLLRQEPEPASDDSSLRPAEWRWRIPEVCDGKWHHYAVSMEFPEARLYVDGKQFISTRHNPEIVDDWPLHVAKQVHSTKLVVGACWQGGKHKMSQYFRGYLAGLSILKNRTESDSVIQCLNNCQEKLDYDAIDTNDDTVVSINSERTAVTVSGTRVESVEKLLQRVSYVNTRVFPTPGHRPVTFETNAVCAGEQKIEVDPLTTLVMVVDAERPTITITGIKNQDVNEHDLSHGVKLFPDLVIDARTKTEDSEMKSSSEETEENKLRDGFQLDSCLIRVDPQLSLSVEHLRYPENLVAQLALDVDFSEDGLVIAGADKLSAYEEVLRGVRYVNSQPEELNSRSFVVTCTELNGRFTSNKHETTLIIVRVIPTAPPAHIAAAVGHVGQQQLGANKQIVGKSIEYHRSVDTPQTGVGVAAVIVACVGFVVLLVALGVARIRNAKRHSHHGAAGEVPGVAVDDRQEMEWDNSALTITVNPMDQEIMYDDELPTTRSSHDSDSEEECSSAVHNPDNIDSSEEDEEEEIEQEPGKVKSRELEWDDSTLSF